MGWITDRLYGVRQIFGNGVLLPERGALNFVGATVADDPANARITVTYSATPLLDSATSAATPNTLAKRSGTGACSFAGTCNFADIAASGSVSCDSITAAATCAAETVTAVSGVNSPKFESPSTGEWQSAAQTAASAASGDAFYGSGASTGATASSGGVLVSSGSTPQVNSISGPIAILTGTSGGISGSLTVGTGDSGGTGASGDFLIRTGNPGGTGLPGQIWFVPGSGVRKGNVTLGEMSSDFGGGQGVVRIAPRASAPSTPLTSGAVVYTKPGGAEGLFYWGVSAIERDIAWPKLRVQATADTVVVCDALTEFLSLTAGAAVAVTIPLGVTGQRIQVAKDGLGAATLSGSGGQQFYSNSLSATYMLNANATILLIFNGVYWRVFP